MSRPFRDTFPHCPRCECALEPLELVTTQRVLSCQQCDGIWSSPEVFKKIAIAIALGPNSKRPQVREREDGPSLGCPICGAHMQKLAVDAIEVDECEGHGTWFDLGELQGVLKSMA